MYTLVVGYLLARVMGGCIWTQSRRTNIRIPKGASAQYTPIGFGFFAVNHTVARSMKSSLDVARRNDL